MPGKPKTESGLTPYQEEALLKIAAGTYTKGGRGDNRAQTAIALIHRGLVVKEAYHYRYGLLRDKLKLTPKGEEMLVKLKEVRYGKQHAYSDQTTSSHAG
jgi:hypothetical protein